MDRTSPVADQPVLNLAAQTMPSDGMTVLLNLEQWVLRLLESQACGPAAITLLLEQLARTLGVQSAALAGVSHLLSITPLSQSLQDRESPGAFALLATTGMTETQANHLLTRYPPTAPDAVPPRGNTRRAQINVPLILLKDHPTSTFEMPDHFTVLYLRWEQARQAREAMTWLPFLVPIVSIALTTLLQREQLRHGEQCHQQPTAPDLFKAEALANMSHELGSPLAAIKGYASTLLRLGHQMDPEEQKAFLQAIQDAGDRMHTVIDHLLKVSQLDVGLRTAQFADVNLVSLAQEALAVAQRSLTQRPQVSETHALFRFVLKNRLPEGEAILQADGALLRDALDNLLGNAIRYSPQGGQITVVLHPFHSEKPIASLPAHIPRVAISITDQGIGIAPEHLPLIFERFYRVDTRLTRETGGLGLGLAMCQRIVELHRGVLQVESTPGRGSTFHLIIPRICLSHDDEA